jgi:hypothetical protein
VGKQDAPGAVEVGNAGTGLACLLVLALLALALGLVDDCEAASFFTTGLLPERIVKRSVDKAVRTTSCTVGEK